MVASRPVHRHGWLAAAPLAIVLLLLLAALIALPGSPMDKLRLALSGICAQRPDHSVVAAGAPVALEARMLGIYVGFSGATTAAWLRGGWRRAGLPRGVMLVGLLALVAAMGFDGANATAHDLAGSALYPPQLWLRLATGLAAGLGLTGIVAPVISLVLWRRPDPRPLFAEAQDLVAPSVVVAGAGGVILAGLGGPLVLSVLALFAVASSFTIVNTYIAALAWEGPGRAESWRDLGGLGAAGAALTGLELAALAAFRVWAEANGAVWLI